MDKIIRIGTRSSELALWQANTVAEQLAHFGHKTEIVKIDSIGDIILDKPLYELGITGVFTKNLDIALLNDRIDIAVHSLKDVPFLLTKGIVQAAAINRGNFKDVLVFKNNEEFLSQQNATILIENARQKAQWLNRYPSHNTVQSFGNIYERLEQLNENTSINAGIFSASELGRLNLKPKNAINLDWMIPTPAQGSIVLTSVKENDTIAQICRELNHAETEICIDIERAFFKLLNGDNKIIKRIFNLDTNLSNISWVDDIDYSFDESLKDNFVEAIKKYWPDIEPKKLQPDYVGIRPKIQNRNEKMKDFSIMGPKDHGVDGLINIQGIESPGVTSCLAIGEYVKHMINLTNDV